MKTDPADRNQAERSWRLVGEFSQPPTSQDEQWVVSGLTGALAGIEGLAPDLDRVTHAVVAAVRRARCCRATLVALGQLLTVRVLILGTRKAGTASPGWGFFVLEPASGGIECTAAERQHAARQVGHNVELYLYTDGG